MSGKPKTAGEDRTILRVAFRNNRPYSQLGNAMIRDNRLSPEAVGILVFILSYPDNWHFSLAWLCRTRNVGRDRAYRIIKELVEFGYCTRFRARKEDGTLGAYEYVFTDEPEGATPPLPENPEVDEEGAPKPTTSWKPVTGQPDLAIRTPTKNVSPTKKVTNRKARRFFEVPSGTDFAADLLAAAQAARAAGLARGASGERLPFTPAVLTELVQLGIDVEALVRRYAEKTKGRRIADPSAYLLRMGRDEAAKMHGVTAEALTKIATRNRSARKHAMAAAVGACAEPSKIILRGFIRRAKVRGDDPDALLRRWRQAIGGQAFRSTGEADRSLSLFEASHREAAR
ncbi:MAG: helix-turn-helix domain-containing protein [Hyphomicrobiaceae bacterium]|nr:MAG: helix-turn-helix domain-containing protein [Hyphomicrobiaceae bacterium]